MKKWHVPFKEFIWLETSVGGGIKNLTYFMNNNGFLRCKADQYCYIKCLIAYLPFYY